MYGLNIHLLSFNLYDSHLRSNDKIRVSITSMPEEYKQAFFIDANKVKDVHHFFTINITERTSKLIFVFRKKSLLQGDPIIASTIVNSDQFPKFKEVSSNTELKQINIYEPIGNNKKNFNANQERTIIGQMLIQFSIEEAFPEEAFTTKCNFNIAKIHNGEGYSKVLGFGFNNENDYQDNSLFAGNYDNIN